jgi:putative DNA primase/helicase
MKGSNDFDNTNIFVKKFKGRVHYLHDEKTWLIWHAKRWKRDVTEFVNELANGVCVSLMRRAGNDSEMRAAKQAGNMKAIESMLKKARVRREIYSESSKFDTDKWLLGCKNGVLNLRTGEFRPARPQDRITRSVSTRFDPSADCPRWEQFMGEIHPNDPEITRFLQRFFGYALTGSVKEQKMLIFLGHGSNGKSTLVNHIQTVMGEYALTCPKSLLLSSKNGESETSPEVTGMKGIRLGTVSETDPGVSLSDSRIKTMVGGEKVTGRDLYKSYETFEPEAKLFLSTNHTPRVKGNDKGIWRRLMLVEFKEDFDDRRDALLDHILETEHAGILNWMLRGCMEWQEKGLCPPPSVIAGTSEYRQGEDHLGTFIEDRVNFTEPGVDTRKSVIYAAYVNWSHVNGSHPMQAASFGKAMTERGGISGRSNSLGRFWTNLVLKDEIMSE